MLKFVYVLWILLAVEATLTFAQDNETMEEEQHNPAAPFNETRGMAWDEVVLDANMKELIDSVARLAKNPDDMKSYMFYDDPRDGIMMEGDMYMTRDQMANIQFMNDAASREKRKAIRDTYYRWKDNVVPYSYRRGHTFSARDRRVIKGALDEWSRLTCLKFRHNPRSRDRIVFQNGKGCSSYVGRIKRAQPVILARGCRYHGIITHEVGHAIGFQHEQTRPDRNKYVTIHKTNIKKETLFNFKKYRWGEIRTFRVPYDYLSIMHYGPKAFSRNGRRTISTKKRKFQNKIGNRRGLSFRDIKLANLIYHCSARCRTKKKCPREGFQDNSCNCRCPGNPIKNCRGRAIADPVPTTTTIKPVTVTAKPYPAGCSDDSPMCREWAVDDGCMKNYVIMSRLCRFTCDLCARVICVDKYRSCRLWKKECETHPGNMERDCPVTCDKCVSGSLTAGGKMMCDDKASDCEKRAQNGECESNAATMKEQCGYTCSYCS